MIKNKSKMSNLLKITVKTAMRFIIGSILIFNTTTSKSATYYVDLTGNDSNPGTQESPWKTIQKAANVVMAGDTVLVGPGNYKELVNLKRPVPLGDYITFDGQNQATNAQFQISIPIS